MQATWVARSDAAFSQSAGSLARACGRGYGPVALSKRKEVAVGVWWLLLWPIVLCLACESGNAPSDRPLQFWHTFNHEESAALQRFLDSGSAPAVETTILPFAQAALRFRTGQQHSRCPDLLRLDSTRVTELALARAIEAVPPAIWQLHSWLPEAEELVQVGDQHYGLPQTLDGLALIRKRSSEGPWPPASLAELSAFAMDQRAPQDGPGLGMLIDGYWFVAFLRSFGSSLPDHEGAPRADSPQAVAALEYFASLFQKGIAMDLLQERSPGRAMVKAFREGQLRVVFTGPWDLQALSDGALDTLDVAAFPGDAGPRGGQVLVVPSCSTQAAHAWQLASELTAPALQASWARELGTIPVSSEGMADSGALAAAFYAALQHARPLPRHTRTPEFFDDLTPAVEAAVGGDATPAEALAGVERAWSRLYGRTKLPANEPADEPADEPAGAGLPMDAGAPTDSTGQGVADEP